MPQESVDQATCLRPGAAAGRSLSWVPVWGQLRGLESLLQWPLPGPRPLASGQELTNRHTKPLYLPRPCVQEQCSSRPPRWPPPGTPNRPLPVDLCPGSWGTSPHGAAGDQGPHPHPARPSPDGRAEGMAWGPGGLRSWQDSVKPPPGVVRRERGQEGHSCVPLVNCVWVLSGHRPRGTQTRPLVTGSSHSAVSECAGLSSA